MMYEKQNITRQFISELVGYFVYLEKLLYNMNLISMPRFLNKNGLNKVLIPNYF